MIAPARIAIDWVEQGFVPDRLIRQSIRWLCRSRLEEIAATDCEATATALRAIIDAMAGSPIAPLPEQANAQHYEVPAAFFDQVLGPRRKYSCGYWPPGVTDLAAAETAALALTCERAGVADGQAILELGCGWGSLTLWLAEHYPAARITAVSNAHAQRQHIEALAAHRGLTNIRVITADMNDFDTEGRFDRVVSVEMFEHMRNYQELMARIHAWLKPGGTLFVHVFSHRHLAYPFETDGADNWMGRYFFTGGLMPSRDLLPSFQDDLKLEEEWHLNGRHYQRTLEAWLANQDRRRAEVLALFRETYGPEQAERWFQRWRVFFMACAELFGYGHGEEWGVSHYRFGKRV